MEEALQCWYQKGLRQLESEANLIREQLLQESLAMRRSLELSSSKSNKSLRSSRQKCVAQLENFHSTLKELSDRLCPPYINEGLPFALHYLTERWQKRLPSCQFELSWPHNWGSQTSTDSLIILNILEYLLRIKEAMTLFNNLEAALSRCLFLSVVLGYNFSGTNMRLLSRTSFFNPLFGLFRRVRVRQQDG